MSKLTTGKQRALLEKIADEIVLDGDPTDFLTVGSAMLCAAFDTECTARGITTPDIYLDAFALDPSMGLIANVIAPASLRKDADAAYTAARIRLDDALEALGLCSE